jgi:hypothetical protein
VLSKTLPEIMLKVLEEFANQLDRLIEHFEAKIAEVMGEMHTLYTRMDALKAKIAPLQAADAQPPCSCHLCKNRYHWDRRNYVSRVDCYGEGEGRDWIEIAKCHRNRDLFVVNCTR